MSDSLWPPWTVACQGLLSMGFSRQEYWSGPPCPPPGDLRNPGTETAAPALRVDSLLLSQWGSPKFCLYLYACLLYLYLYICMYIPLSIEDESLHLKGTYHLHIKKLAQAWAIIYPFRKSSLNITEFQYTEQMRYYTLMTRLEHT